MKKALFLVVLLAGAVAFSGCAAAAPHAAPTASPTAGAGASGSGASAAGASGTGAQAAGAGGTAVDVPDPDPDPDQPGQTPPVPVDDAAGDATVDRLDIEMSGAAVCENHQDVLVALPQTTLSLTGNCGTVTLTGDFETVTLDKAAVISIESEMNTVTATTAGEVDVSGSENTVSWHDGASNANDTGKSNTLQH